MQNALNWFEIPISDMDRATRFYEQVLGVRLRRETFGGMPLAVFPYDAPEGPGPRGVGGALARMPNRKPSSDGTLVYLDASGKLDEVLGRVPAAGGEVVMPRTDIGVPGFIAVMRDPDGNLVGLHSPR